MKKFNFAKKIAILAVAVFVTACIGCSTGVDGDSGDSLAMDSYSSESTNSTVPVISAGTNRSGNSNGSESSTSSSGAATASGSETSANSGTSTTPATATTVSTNVDTCWITINPGTFQMGTTSSSGEFYARGIHTETITKAFEMCDHEVTQAEWKNVMGNLTPGLLSASSKLRGNDYPADCVSWYDAINYCNALSAKEGRTPAYTVNGTNVSWNENANGYRLPTEAEWEYAARAGNTTTNALIWSGTSDESSLGNYAWYDGNKDKYSKTVKTKLPNAWGLYDMSGSVKEWCWNAPSDDPSRRSIRGGNRKDIAIFCSVTCETNPFPDGVEEGYGLRLVRNK